MQILKLSTGSHTPTAAWDGKEIWLDCSAGPVTIALPQAGAFGKLRFKLRKADPSSNTVQIIPTWPGDKLNHFWNSGHPYGLFLNLSQQCAELSCDGVQDYALAGMLYHHNGPQSQRTVITQNWALTPESANEIVRCDPGQAGGDIGIYVSPCSPHWCPPSPMTGGNYHSFTVWVQKVDAGAGKVAIIPTGSGERIYPSNDAYINPGYDRGYLYLTERWQIVKLYIASDGIKVIDAFRSALIPGAV
jgi:hypothetical protein